MAHGSTACARVTWRSSCTARSSASCSASCRPRAPVPELRVVRRSTWPLLLVAASALAAWPLPAAAEFGSIDFGLGRDVDVRLLHGYPTNANSYYGPFTVGVQLRNRGA